MRSIVDTHSHIDLPVFDDREAMLQRALDAGVHAIVMIGFNPERWERTRELRDQYPFLARTAGVHPNDAETWTDDVREALERDLARGDAIAVGEIGLDFYREHASPASQRRAFAEQIELAQAHELPIVIHQRQAEEEVLEMLRPHAPVRGVMHCFSGGVEFARSCLDLGLQLGIGGVATYPKSTETRNAVRYAPLDRLIVETDAPYLAPQPWRGKRNEPAYVMAALDVIATEKDLPVESAAGQTTDNACTLFGETLRTALLAGQERAACA